jgi:hypothetical protein
MHISCSNGEILAKPFVKCSPYLYLSNAYLITQKYEELGKQQAENWWRTIMDCFTSEIATVNGYQWLFERHN